MTIKKFFKSKSKFKNIFHAVADSLVLKNHFSLRFGFRKVWVEIKGIQRENGISLLLRPPPSLFEFFFSKHEYQ